jgi:hypothetical protein
MKNDNGIGKGTGVVFENKCNFLDGLPLTGKIYTQSRTLNGSNGKGSWTFTWTYKVEPTSSYPALAFTAWDLVSERGDGNGLADVSIDAFIAGLSAQKTNRRDLTKYSFSLDNSDGTSRVSDVIIKVIKKGQGGDPDVTIHVSASPESTHITSNSQEAPVDFNYTPNGGSFYGSNGTTSLLTTGDARGILNNDGFAGNDNGGADGRALAYASLDAPITLELGPGRYVIEMTGTVKGNNSTSVTTRFNVNGNINVVTPGCGGGNN